MVSWRRERVASSTTTTSSGRLLLITVLCITTASGVRSQQSDSNNNNDLFQCPEGLLYYFFSLIITLCHVANEFFFRNRLAAVGKLRIGAFSTTCNVVLLGPRLSFDYFPHANVLVSRKEKRKKRGHR